MVFNMLKSTALLPLHSAENIFEAEGLTSELISEQYTVPLSEAVYNFLIWFFVVLAVFLFICRFALGLEKFKRELRYLNMEIRRTRGSERKYWKKKKRRLWLSLFLPHKG